MSRPTDTNVRPDANPRIPAEETTGSDFSRPPHHRQQDENPVRGRDRQDSMESKTAELQQREREEKAKKKDR